MPRSTIVLLFGTAASVGFLGMASAIAAPVSGNAIGEAASATGKLTQKVWWRGGVWRGAGWRGG
jgi:hypothetical protein